MSYRRIALCAASGAIIYFAYKTLKDTDVRGKLSVLCESLATDPVIEPDLARDAFATQHVDPVSLVPGHTHPAAAGIRSAATNFAKKVASHCGVQLYVIGMSKSDQRKNMAGSRQWYWAKDTNVKNRADKPNIDDIEYVCDVDYYLDMPHLLASRDKPTLLYSVVPEAAATSGKDDTSTCFDEVGMFCTLVAGGGTYKHFLWDYSGDSFTVEIPGYFFPRRLITYAVERKQAGLNRQLILLTPIKRFDGWAAVLASCLIEKHALKRFNPIQMGESGNKYVRFNVHRNDGTFVTTGRPNSLLCATIPTEIDSAIAGVARLGSTKLMLPTTASWLETAGRPAAVILTEFFRDVIPKPSPYVFPVEHAVRAYQYEPRLFDQEAKPKLQAFMSPIVHGAFAPVPNAAGERQCVKGRITDLQNGEPKPHTFRDQCLGEFAHLVAGGANLDPVCVDVVIDKQTTPAQKLSLMKAAVYGMVRKAILKCFIKSEAYPDVKDPRNISTYNDADKLEMAQFALAFSAYLKQFPWYGPGKTPVEIATRVADICMAALEYVNVSDLHRMDGTITFMLRMVDRVTLMKAFPRHRGVLNELLKRNVNNIGYLPNGTTFSQGSVHGSGCSATSLLQTLRAAFAAYLGFRHTLNPNTGACFTPNEAFAALGLHFGDDGIDADLPIESHLWACERVGLQLDACLVLRGTRGVNFLARYYSPQVWTGCVDSMCDLRRQLSKFHTTVRLPDNVTPEQKLIEKACSYLATDANTPVMGTLCKKVLMLSDWRPKTLHGIGNWWSRFEDSVQYPNNNVDGWMDVELEHQLGTFDRSMFDVWMAGAKQMSEIIAAPLCAEPKPATPGHADAVVDGDVLLAKAIEDVAAKEKENPKEQEGRPSKTSSEQYKRKGKSRKKKDPRSKM